MRKSLILSFLLALMALGARADSKETVTVNGTVVDHFATHITFNGNLLTLTYDDGTTQTAPMDATHIALSYVAVLSETPTLPNVETIRTFGDRMVPVEVRREVKAGTWNTICLPFAMTADEITTIFGEGTQVARLESAGDGQVRFVTTTGMEADMPYLLYPTHDISSFALQNSILSHYAEGATVSDGPYHFKGTYDDVTPAELVFDLTTDGHVSPLASGSVVKALRAYLTAPEGTAEGTFTVDGSDVGITAIPSDSIIHNGGVFNLHGQRVTDSTSHLPQGIYIVNGKKIVVNH